MKQKDLQFVKDTLLELDPGMDGSEQNKYYLTALVAVSALLCGPDTKRLAKFTELPWDFVETIRQRMVQAELWTERDIVCDHWFGEGKLVCTAAIWLDVLIAEGLVVRQWDEETGDYRYYDATYAPRRDDSPQKVN